MKLDLKRPLVFFDIESTGLNIATDSIVELSFVKIMPGNEERIKTWRVKPWDYVANKQKAINPEAMKVHGISNEELSDCPTFQEILPEVIQWLENCDLSGFNSAKFDLPMLAEEIERVRKYTDLNPEINLHDKLMVDVQNIYHKLEPRNLKAAYRFYCNDDLENAHSAEADTYATYKILEVQLDKYPEDLKNDVDYLASYSRRQNPVDYAGRLAYNDKNEAIVTFGKHKGKTAREVYFNEPSYFAWIENGEFTLDTKRQFALLKEKFEEEKREQKQHKTEIDNRPPSETSLNDLKDKWGGQGSLF